MTDIVDSATRSRMMARIPSRDTKPELLLRQELREQGLVGYRCHYKRAPGRPDVAFVSKKLAVFVDGAFWHGHPDYYTFGKSGPAWDVKIRRNAERDEEVDAALTQLGWNIVRAWDFEVIGNPEAVVRRITPYLH